MRPQFFGGELRAPHAVIDVLLRLRRREPARQRRRADSAQDVGGVTSANAAPCGSISCTMR